MDEKILVVEDEPALQETLAYNLKLEGYYVEICGNGVESLKIARDSQPDLILMDVMLPGMNGFEVCKILRRETDIPIILLTARADEVDRVVGFEIGADDYVTKPFSMGELMARVKTRLRSYQQPLDSNKLWSLPQTSAQQKLTFGTLVINVDRHEASLDGTPLKLKPKEYELLKYLAENRGRALTREQILEWVWGWRYIGNDRTVDVHIRWLRSKIEHEPAKPTRILTVPGTGYRFEG